ncbi:MAG: toprim domain-containing protein [Clostridia bacterium]|nr:toprim domain-containing protein [Clostridia bacterium]
MTLVEGYMDVVALTQFGVPGVCATLGTALTPEQARLLKRFAPKVFLGYDGDSAGQHAILRGLDILQAEGIPCRVLDFPDGQDPDEFIRDKGPEAFAALPAISPETYRLRRLKEQFDLSTQEGRTDYAKGAADILKNLEPVELENHLQDLMVQTGFTRDVLLAQIGIKPAKSSSSTANKTPARPVIRVESEDEKKAQELLLALAATGRIPEGVMTQEDFEDPLLKELYLRLASGSSPAALVEEQETEQARAKVSALLLTPPGEDKDQLIQMAQDCLTALRLQRIEKRLGEIMQSINSLTGPEKTAAMAEVAALSTRKKELKQKH